MKLQLVTERGREEIYFTYQEVADRWKCSKSTVIRRVRAGALETVGEGTLTRVTIESLLAYEEATRKRRRAS